MLGEDALWAHYCRRDLPPQLWRGGGAPLAAAPALESAHLAAYQRIHRLQLMNEVAWLSQERAAAAGRGPRAREGHAACAWGRRSMLVSCGFGGGIISDLMLLTPTAPAPGAAQGGPAYRWVQPRCAGRFPVHRYGHTMTRCGPGGEYALVFGGLMAGGYQVGGRRRCCGGEMKRV